MRDEAADTTCASVSVRYANGDWGLRRVDCKFPAGSHTLVIGTSGSGKSTLLNALAGLAPVTEGCVRVAGRPMRPGNSAATAAWRRQVIGTVFQHGLLLPELSARDNVALPLRLLGVSRSVARRRAGELMDRLAIGDAGRKPPWQLSGGQRQRVAVARAVVHRPRVILADEPTGALDGSNSELVLGLLIETATALDSTLVVVSHDLRLGPRFPRLLELRDGAVAGERGA